MLENTEKYLEKTDLSREHVELDVGDLPPPEPLKNTLEKLTELDDDVAVVQYNDRKPKYLFPKLEERGYSHQTYEDERVVTVIWKK
ncbi:MAG: DUF2249 domain-containing protein [Halobacteria archaeon]